MCDADAELYIWPSVPVTRNFQPNSFTFLVFLKWYININIFFCLLNIFHFKCKKRSAIFIPYQFDIKQDTDLKRCTMWRINWFWYCWKMNVNYIVYWMRCTSKWKLKEILDFFFHFYSFLFLFLFNFILIFCMYLVMIYHHFFMLWVLLFFIDIVEYE